MVATLIRESAGFSIRLDAPHGADLAALRLLQGMRAQSRAFFRDGAWRLRGQDVVVDARRAFSDAGIALHDGAPVGVGPRLAPATVPTPTPDNADAVALAGRAATLLGERIVGRLIRKGAEVTAETRQEVVTAARDIFTRILTGRALEDEVVPPAPTAASEAPVLPVGAARHIDMSESSVPRSALGVEAFRALDLEPADAPDVSACADSRGEEVLVRDAGPAPALVPAPTPVAPSPAPAAPAPTVAPAGPALGFAARLAAAKRARAT